MFAKPKFEFNPAARSTILDYAVDVRALNENDRILSYGDLGDFSITGVEIIFTRHKLKYMYMYYLPSGNFDGYSHFGLEYFGKGKIQNQISSKPVGVFLLDF